MPDKLIISPGQALLLLMDHYKSDPIRLAELKKQYVLGVSSAGEIEALRQDTILSGYVISDEKQVINEDPSLRYFESHLAMKTLNNGLEDIELNELELHCAALYNASMQGCKNASKKRHSEFSIRQINNTLAGKLDDQMPLALEEYAFWISKIDDNDDFKHLSEDNRKKMKLLVKISFLGFINAFYNNESLPLDIYNRGIYSQKSRGLITRDNQETTQSQSWGIMKSHMPLPGDDVTRASSNAPFHRSPERSHYNEDADWVKLNFERSTLPFVNSISGTVLCQLKSIAGFLNQGQSLGLPRTAKEYEQFFKLFISDMLFVSGGHSLLEYTTPITLPQVREQFKDVPDFETIDMESMFFSDNTTSVNEGAKARIYGAGL